MAAKAQFPEYKNHARIATIYHPTCAIQRKNLFKKSLLRNGGTYGPPPRGLSASHLCRAEGLGGGASVEQRDALRFSNGNSRYGSTGGATVERETLRLKQRIVTVQREPPLRSNGSRCYGRTGVVNWVENGWHHSSTRVPPVKREPSLWLNRSRYA